MSYKTRQFKLLSDGGFGGAGPRAGQIADLVSELYESRGRNHTYRLMHVDWDETSGDGYSFLPHEVEEVRDPEPPAATPPATPTLRDQFAMAALSGLLASPFDPIDLWQPHIDAGYTHLVSLQSEMAYDYADAMLAARDAAAGSEARDA